MRESTTSARLVLALSDGATTVQRLQSAFGSQLRTFQSAEALLEASRAADVDLVIVPWCDRGASLVPTIAAIRASRRNAPVRVYVERSAGCLHALVSLARAGASGVIVRDVDDDVTSLQRLLERGTLVRALETVTHAVRCVVHERHQPLFLLCLEQVEDPPPASEFARRLRVSRRTLSTWARKAGAKGVRSLASKCRVLVAIELIRESNRTLEQVAHLLQFASSAHLHNTIRRYTGVGPRDAAARNVAEWCRLMFAAEVARPRGRTTSLPGNPGFLPRNGRIDLTMQRLTHSTTPVPGEMMQ